MPTEPTPGQRALLDRYLDELALWNRRVNLTAVPRDQAWDRHVAETLALVGVAGWPQNARAVDIGSGGGVPGIVVAVLRPDLAVTLVESDRRKAGFLIHVCGLLGLGQVRVAAERAEALARDPAHAAAYDVAMSRACAPPAQLAALTLPLLRVGGSLWAMVRDADAAVDEVRAAGVRAAPDAVAAGVMRVTRT